MNRLARWLERNVLVKWFARTILIGTILIPLDYYGYLGWLDATILRLGQFDAYHQSSPDKKKLPVTVIEISQEMYEEYFEYQSPLSRAKLAEIIQLISLANPSTLTIDLDLSPQLNSQEQSQLLYRQLGSLIDDGVSINLALPFGVNTRQKYLANLSWVDDMCSRGIEFAEPVVLHNNRTVLKMAKVSEAMPTTLYEQTAIANKQLDKRTICSWSLDDLTSPISIKSRLFESSSSASAMVDHRTLQVLNVNLLRQLQIISVETLDGLRKVVESSKWDTVFLGGAYGNEDFFYIADQNIPGVRLQAVEYLNIIYPVETSNLVALLLEVIVGVIFIFFFQALWKNRQRCLSIGAGQYATRVFLDVLIIGYTLFYILLIAVLITPYFLTYAVWLNPAPIVAALVFDFLSHTVNQTSEQKGRTNYFGINKIVKSISTGVKLCFGFMGLWIVLFS
ncbi:CHASE2 domain-containing protein [Paraferrimonas sedimenticola]|uniref:CHASE2 domain-containing protein n=1 Tax=Paraferrimonas sedimenticola TaxID=375674 RepID=UPI000BA9C7C9|nr:CHASE2 domain-containing protein [Paraferrimonas sedimenticola]